MSSRYTAMMSPISTRFDSSIPRWHRKLRVIGTMCSATPSFSIDTVCDSSGWLASASPRVPSRGMCLHSSYVPCQHGQPGWWQPRSRIFNLPAIPMSDMTCSRELPFRVLPFLILRFTAPTPWAGTWTKCRLKIPLPCFFVSAFVGHELV